MQSEIKQSDYIINRCPSKCFSHFDFHVQYLRVAEQVSRTLQSSSIDAMTAVTCVTMLLKMLKDMRSDEKCLHFYRSCTDVGVTKLNYNAAEDSIPRVRRVPKRFAEGMLSHTWTCAEDYCRAQYYEVLDLLISELKRRFDQQPLNKLISVISCRCQRKSSKQLLTHKCYG